MSKRMSRSITAGVILIVLGVLILYANLKQDVSLFSLIWRFLPLLLIWVGLRKAYRYFRPTPVAPDVPLPSQSLSPALLWIAFGLMFLLAFNGVIPHLGRFFGTFWPLALVLLGLGKIVDGVTPEHIARLRAGEIVFSLFLILFGVTTYQVVNLDWSNIPMFHISGGKGIILRDWFQNSYTFTREESVPLSGVKAIALSHENGTIELYTVEGTDLRVTLNEKIYAMKDADAQAIHNSTRLNSKQDSEKLILNTTSNTSDTSSVTIDLRVGIPSGYNVQIDNVNGDIVCRGLTGAAVLSCRSGDIKISEHIGDLQLTQRYNDMELEQIKGNVTIDSTKTDVRAEKIQGEVAVTCRQGGSLTLQDVLGNAKVKLDKSSAEIIQVTGKLEIDNNSTKATVTTLIGDLNFTGATGKFIFEDINGLIQGTNRLGSVKITNCRKNVDMTLERCRVELSDVGGGAKISNTSNDIILNNVKGEIDASNSGASIIIKPIPQDKATRVQVQTVKGDIRFLVASFPEARSFYLTADPGFIKSDFATSGLEMEKREKMLIWRNVKGGPETASLRCTVKYGEIRFEKSDQAEADRTESKAEED